MDVLRRYDVDGIHFDDYFYPYPSYNGGRDFPDGESWAAYRSDGGKLSLSDWRRDNVNQFIKRLYRGIKREKPYVKFGLSPFGIWRPGHPPSISGLDQYEVLYADARRWLQEGWVDYLSPQLYWPIRQVPRATPCSWPGGRRNTQARHVWPGLYASGIKDARSHEIVNQIMVARAMGSTGAGHVHFSMKAREKTAEVSSIHSGRRPMHRRPLCRLRRG